MYSLKLAKNYLLAVYLILYVDFLKEKIYSFVKNSNIKSIYA